MEAKKFKNIEVINLYHALSAVKGIKAKSKFTYTIAKSLAIVNYEVDAFKAVEKEMADIMAEYRKEEGELLVKYAVQGPQGFYIPNDQPEKLEAYNAAYEALSEKYKEQIAEFNEKDAEYKELLQEEVELTFPTVSGDLIPDELTSEQVEKLMIAGIIE